MSLTKKELTDKNLYELEISVDHETFEAAINRAYKKQVGKFNIPGFRRGKAPRNMIEKLYGKQLQLSASQIDRQAECRLSYFLRYGLRAQERKEAAVDPAEFGTFVHAVLENTVDEVMEKGGFHAVSEEETLDIAHKYAESYAAERFKDLDSERVAYLFRRNGLELDMVVQELWEELSSELS